MAKKSLKKSLKKSHPVTPDPVPEGSDVEAVNRLATSVPNAVVPKPVDDHKVRADDIKRSVDKKIEGSHTSDEAVVAAGLPLKGYDEKLVGTIAAVPADGATGTVGWVTARRIVEAIKGK